VPLHFFEQFMSEHHKESNKVVVQVLPPNWQAVVEHT
jgi:hypothetical protein